jgi:hypothetical protein
MSKLEGLGGNRALTQKKVAAVISVPGTGVGAMFHLPARERTVLLPPPLEMLFKK